MLRNSLNKIECEEVRYIKILDGESTLKVAICDDENHHIQELKKIIHSINNKTQVQTFLSVTSFLETLKNGEQLPNVIFLDIEMPEMDGITLGKKIQNISTDIFIIFATSHPEYAMKGYEARAFRYILKPFSEEVISKILFDIKEEERKKKKIILQSDGKDIVITLQDILYICAEDKYTVLYTKEHHCIERISLNEYEELLLPYGFYRVHRKYIVNFFYCKRMEKGKVYLTNDVSVPISRRREKEYRKELLRYLEMELI